MTEHYTNEQFGKYRTELPEVLKHVAGSAMKYGSIVAGIYAVCKDEKDFAMATMAGLVYLVGDVLKKQADQITETKQFSKLEETLKKE